MLVFVIPTWFPTPERPTWCNWILPHISITENIADVVILQVDQDALASVNPQMQIHNNHYYLACPIKKSRFNRTIFGFDNILKSYTTSLELLFSEAVKKHGKPDVIHAHVSMQGGYGASVIAEKYKIPVIVTEHYSGFFSDHRFPWRIGYYYQKMRKNISGLYVVSTGFKENIEKQTKIFVDGVIPNPINTDLFRPTENRKKEAILRLVSTGNVGRIKGTDVLLKAVLSMPTTINWRLKIIGNLPLDKSGWDLLNDSRIELIDRKTQIELAEIYSQSDYFILSSRVETANVSMLEAMSCGCYVVSSDIAGPKSLLDKSVSTLFRSENHLELKNILSEAIKFDRNIQRQYVYENYSEQVIEKKLKDVYEKTIQI